MKKMVAILKTISTLELSPIDRKRSSPNESEIKIATSASNILAQKRQIGLKNPPTRPKPKTKQRINKAKEKKKSIIYTLVLF
jgi:hypothetical protein